MATPKPPVAAKPATAAKPTATAKPRVIAKPRAAAKPRVTAKPRVVARAKPTGTATPAAVAAPPTAGVESPTGLDLYFVRHAHAGDPATWVGDDADRPLSKKGRRQARRLGRLLKDLDARADAILTSSKMRAADTAKLVGRAIGTKPAADERLTLDFGRDQLAALVAGLGAEVCSVILVGHDPDFSAIVSWLAGAQIEMQKGAIVRIDLASRQVGPGRGSLRWLLPPDAIPG